MGNQQPGPIAQQLQKIQANGQTPPPAPQPVPQKKSRFGFSNKTLWDWISVLLVPVMIAAGSVWFSIQINNTNLQIAQDNRLQDLEIAKQNREKDLAIEENRKRAEVLKTYMDDITTLILHEGLNDSQVRQRVSKIATAKTFLALEQLDGERKGSLVVFIARQGLIEGDIPIIYLGGRYLHGAVKLSDFEAKRWVTGYVDGANLRGVYLRGVYLRKANLEGADLRGADLRGADLIYAILGLAGLNGANLEGAGLLEANLEGANLEGADLVGADLRDANLRGANLTNAKVTNEQISQAFSLYGALLPNGSKCESDKPTDCLK